MKNQMTNTYNTSLALLAKQDKTGIIPLMVFLAGTYSVTYSFDALAFWNFDVLHYVLFQFVSFSFFLFYKLAFDNTKLIMPVQQEKNDLPETYITEIPDRALDEAENIENPETQIFSEELDQPQTPIPELEEDLVIPSHPYSDTCQELLDSLKSTLNTPLEREIKHWENIVNISYPVPLKVYRDRRESHRYRMETTFNNSPAVVFDQLDFSTNLSEDSVIKKYLKQFEDIEILDANTNILYICTMAMWPTSARDLCLLQTAKSYSDGSFIRAFKSIDHPQRPSISTGVVRMDAHLSGMWFRPVEKELKQCQLTAYFHGDPKGWVPKSLVTFVASNLLPKMFEGVNGDVKNLPYSQESKTLITYQKYSNSQSSSASKKPATFAKFYVASPEDELADPITPNFTSSYAPPVTPNSPTSPAQVELSSIKLPDQPKFPLKPIKIIHPQVIPSRKRDTTPPTPPSLWERIKSRFSMGWVSKIATSTVPVLILTAVLTIVARRNRLLL